ncbi:MAG: hypothetical protein FI719_08135 [SAR202 cluster bacterium]|nr:hypothetical protein [SAR202 cluster bacterium]
MYRPEVLSYVFNTRWLIVLLVTVVLGGVSEAGLKKGHAQSVEPFTIRDSGVQSQFPEGLTFTIDIQSEIRIDDVRVTFEVGGRGTTQYAYLDLDQSNRPLINGEWFQRTNSNDRYIPPGSMIKYWFEIIDENGDSYFTEPETWRFDDSRFEWDEVTVGTVTVLYHGPVRTRAERLANAAIQSLELMAEVTGADTQTPIVMVLYNNNAEMIEAVVAKSLASSRELITEGQAFDAESVVLVLAGRSDVGTATHEMTHILVARAAGSRASVPLWLNEGLAEYGNLDQTISYERFLEWAVGTDRLIPLKSLRSFPGDPNLTLVAYGQGRSVVKYMIDEFGTEKMSELLATLGTGIGIDDALGAVYGFGIRGLEDKWRESIGADPYIEPTPGPTPTPSADPTPTYRLLTQPPESVELEPESVRADQPAESPEVLDSSSERDHSTADEVSLSARGAIHQFVALMFIILSLMLFVAHSYAFRIKRDS